MIGTSYAWWTSFVHQKGINEIQSTCIKMELINEQNEISLKDAYPLTDEEAKKLTPYTFTIRNTCNSLVDYTVKLEKLSNSENQDKLLDSKYVAVEFNGGQKQILSEYPDGTSTYKEEGYTTKETKNLIKGTLKGEETKTYTIKLWMDEHVTIKDDAMNKSFISKIVVDGSINEVAVYDEPILHGADPVLESNKPVAMQTASGELTTTDKLIPVIINEEDGKVTKANTSHDWYNYEEKRWANAVILADNTKEYKDGATIPEDQIESYFVWIPKYRYKLFDMGTKYTSLQDGELTNKAHAIEINFGTKNTNDENSGECTTPTQSGDSGNCDVDMWMTHPAFTAFEGSKGIWVGKFETGYDGAANTAEAEKDTNEPTKVIIKPNVYSWRNITVGNAFKTSKSYEPTLMSHMMKNTEWGAVAYLQHSKYGSSQSVRINNNSNYVTGYAAKNEPTTGFTGTNTSENIYEAVTPNNNGSNTYNYKDSNSKMASTTNNYTGIYDMSGGAWEYMASTVTNKSDTLEMLTNDKSGLTTDDIPNLCYIDMYKTGIDVQYNRRILGDATGEMGPFVQVTYEDQHRNIGSWYKDDSRFVAISFPWFARGGLYSYGDGAGMFSFFRYEGKVYTQLSFRIVLTPIN